MARRAFLRLAGGTTATVALGGLAAGCGSSSESTATAAGSGGAGKVGGTLNLFVWEGYDLTDEFAAWRKKHHIKQNVKYITNPGDVPVILKGPGGDKWDMSYGDNASLDYLKQLGLIAPVSVEEVPNLKLMFPFFRDAAPWKNSDGTYNGIPWTWGFSGLTYRVGKVPEPKSWFDILDPKYKGRVGTIDDAYNNVTLAAVAVGINPDDLTKDQLNGPVKDYLLRLRKNLRALSASIGDQVSTMVSGNVDYMVVGLTLIDAEAKKKGVTTKTVAPKEGAIGWADTTFITPTAPDRANALAFANRLLDPKANAKANSALLQGTALPSSVPMLSPEARALYPYGKDFNDYLSKDLIFNRGYPHQPQGDRATYDDLTKLWEEVKAS